ncbi:hypothetical protein EVAR_83216_1 [Eumeta japonica]|uniref:Uncharacterized protein n=1 Tax=Eumeta variegata TaxID=151549 RepID=A0A4C1Y1Z2_EUMVA|nr:hypothetical protein EVAR_83216_1 [Eumeta japonica]
MELSTAASIDVVDCGFHKTIRGRRIKYQLISEEQDRRAGCGARAGSAAPAPTRSAPHTFFPLMRPSVVIAGRLSARRRFRYIMPGDLFYGRDCLPRAAAPLEYTRAEPGLAARGAGCGARAVFRPGRARSAGPSMPIVGALHIFASDFYHIDCTLTSLLLAELSPPYVSITTRTPLWTVQRASRDTLLLFITAKSAAKSPTADGGAYVDRGRFYDFIRIRHVTEDGPAAGKWAGRARRTSRSAPAPPGTRSRARARTGPWALSLSAPSARSFVRGFGRYFLFPARAGRAVRPRFLWCYFRPVPRAPARPAPRRRKRRGCSSPAPQHFSAR